MCAKNSLIMLTGNTVTLVSCMSSKLQLQSIYFFLGDLECFFDREAGRARHRLLDKEVALLRPCSRRGECPAPKEAEDVPRTQSGPGRAEGQRLQRRWGPRSGDRETGLGGRPSSRGSVFKDAGAPFEVGARPRKRHSGSLPRFRAPTRATPFGAEPRPSRPTGRVPPSNAREKHGPHVTSLSVDPRLPSLPPTHAEA